MGAQLISRAASAARFTQQCTRRVLLGISIVAVVVLGALITSSVLGRALFGTPIPDDVVLAEGILIATVMLPLAAVQADSGHIRVELFGDSWGRFVPLTMALGNLIGALLFFALGYAALDKAIVLFQSGEYYQGVLRVPIWPSKGLFAIGALVLSIELAIGVFRPRTGSGMPGHHSTD